MNKELDILCHNLRFLKIKYRLSQKELAKIGKVARALIPESDFETRIFRCDFVKILVNPIGFTVFLPRTPKNSLFTKFYDLKCAVFCEDFGKTRHIRLSPMC